MGIPGVKLKKQDIIDALVKNEGIITHAAKTLGCVPQTIYTWIESDEDIRLAVERERDKYEKSRQDHDVVLKKKAYTSMEHLLDTYDVSATIFTMKAKAGWQQDRMDVAITIRPIDKPYQE